MNTLTKVIDLYKLHGFDIRVGLNPSHFSNNKEAPFAILMKNGNPFITGGGIGLQDFYFFELLFSSFKPKNLFAIGNAFGWSSLILSLLNKEAKVIVIDAGIEGKDNDFGINLTNQIADSQNMNLRVIKAFSPDDVHEIVKNNFDVKIDFVFIDGLHTDEQQYKDYKALTKHVSDECILVFHDVINFNMVKSFQRISTDANNMKATILHRTNSGMGILYPANTDDNLKKIINAFTEHPSYLKKLRKESGIYKTFLRNQRNRVVNLSKVARNYFKH